MVHALEEIHRVLVPGGILLDLRPIADRWPIEIVQNGNPFETGRMTDLQAGIDADLAANQAIEEIIRRGRFEKTKNVTFYLFDYWNDPDEMSKDLTERWADDLKMEENVEKATRTAWTARGV